MVVVAMQRAVRCQGREEVAALVRAAESNDWHRKGPATEIQLATGQNHGVD